MNGFQGGYGAGGGARAGGLEGAQDRERGPRPPFRGGRRGGYRDSEFGDDYKSPPRRTYERHSGTGRGYEMKCEGAGCGNWGTSTDEILARETEEALKLDEKAPIPKKQGALEDPPQVEENKDSKDAIANEEEEKEMTLEEFEKLREEKRKALLGLKTKERKVEVDKDLQSMQPLLAKKGNDDVFIKLLGSFLKGWFGIISKADIRHISDHLIVGNLESQQDTWETLLPLVGGTKIWLACLPKATGICCSWHSTRY